MRKQLTAGSRQLFSQKATSQMFERVLNTPLLKSIFYYDDVCKNSERLKVNLKQVNTNWVVPKTNNNKSFKQNISLKTLHLKRGLLTSSFTLCARVMYSFEFLTSNILLQFLFTNLILPWCVVFFNIGVENGSTIKRKVLIKLPGTIHCLVS